MCRFLAYQGHPVVIADLLYRPRHSLVHQSQHSEQLPQPFNADGFGVGFYVGADPTPCVMRATGPAWSNRSLESLADKLSSQRLFAHVRAASPGLPVQVTNCHPFWHGRFLFMHNGAIEGFRKAKRRLQNALSDRAWELIEGSTDSEHAFALFMDEIGGGSAEPITAELRSALVRTLVRLREIVTAAGASDAMACNFAVTDGRSTVVTRYGHNLGREPASLHYSAGSRYVCEGGDGDMRPGEDPRHGAVIVASEPLSRDASDWQPVPANHTVAIAPDGSLSIDKIEI
jgi:glutamine amidotransferase